MTVEKTYYPLPTLNTITDSGFAYTQIYMVARSGVVHSQSDVDADLVSGSPFYAYDQSTGTITFNPNIPFNENESINVVYEIS